MPGKEIDPQRARAARDVVRQHPAMALAAVNVFGGFLVTRRMLEMFKKKDKKGAAK